MSISVTYSNTVNGITKTVSQSIDSSLGRAVLYAANIAGGFIQENAQARHSGGKGALKRSFLPAKYISKSDSISAGALSGLIYSRILDRGGFVSPKKMKMLAIPLGSAPNSTKRRWPRDWPKGSLFLYKSKAGNLLLAENTKKGKLKFHYILKESIEITPSNYISDAFDRSSRELPEIIAEDLGKEIAKKIYG